MRWLTLKEIHACASDKEALICSIKHWKQIRRTSWKELKRGVYYDKVHYTGKFCALCQRAPFVCPLKGRKCNGLYCVPEWTKVQTFVYYKIFGERVRECNEKITEFIKFLESK